MDHRARRPGFVYVVFLVALLALTFAPHLAGSWVWDDVYLVRDNANVHGGLSGLGALVTRDLWGSAGRTPSDLYHPVPMAVMWLVARGGGESVVPFRVVNLGLHLACVLLFAAWLRRRGVPGPGVALTSLVFAVHPLVTEPVMWVTGCHDTLAVLGGLTALLTWPREGEPRVTGRLAVATLATAWAALCKEPYFVLPALLELAAAAGDGAGAGTEPFRARQVRRRMLLAAAPAGGLVLVVALRHHLGIPTGSARLQAGPRTLLVDYATIVGHYLERCLTFDGGVTADAYRPLSGAAAALVLVLVGAVAVLLFVRLRRRAPGADVAAVGWGWFALGLAPHAIAAPSIGMYGNRYAYFPMMGLAAALLGVALPLAAHLRGPLVGVVRWAAPIAVLAIVPFTAAQARLWRDELTLFGADVVRSPRDPRALYHYGHAVRMESGCAAALPFFTRSTDREPGFGRAWHNVAGCLVDLRRYPEALGPAEVAYRLQPGDAGAAFNLAVARLGTGDAPGGRSLLVEAVRLDPHHAGAVQLLTRMSGAAAGASP